MIVTFASILIKTFSDYLGSYSGVTMFSIPCLAILEHSVGPNKGYK